MSGDLSHAPALSNELSVGACCPTHPWVRPYASVKHNFNIRQNTKSKWKLSSNIVKWNYISIGVYLADYRKYFSLESWQNRSWSSVTRNYDAQEKFHREIRWIDEFWKIQLLCPWCSRKFPPWDPVNWSIVGRTKPDMTMRLRITWPFQNARPLAWLTPKMPAWSKWHDSHDNRK